MKGSDMKTLQTGHVGKLPSLNQYWSFTAHDRTEEMELTFHGVTDKKKVLVVFKRNTLYVEYDGREFFGLTTSQMYSERKKETDGNSKGCKIEEIDEKLPDDLKTVVGDPKKRGGELRENVDTEDCTWTIIDGTLQVTLCKVKEGPWVSVLKSEK